MVNQGNIPISRTKVVMPRRRAELLTRQRLLNMVNEFLDKKLVLVSAPAGYGKTSLLIDLGYQSELPFCWLSLDELDQDPQRFITYFVEAISERFPGFGDQAKTVLNELTSIYEGLERLMIPLVNEIYNQIPQHFVLVLDDYHLVSDVPIIQNFIGRFIQLVDDNCHLIVSSRALTQLPDLPLMVARDMVGGLDLDSLAFRADEIQALFAQNYNKNISDEKAQELVDATEGWITGLQLSSLDSDPAMGDKLKVARAAGVDLFDYLGQQVLDQQPEEIRFFLLRSSLLEEFDASLCEDVLGKLYPDRKEWNSWINTVIENNLFALPVGVESGSVRYHHLFRDFLQDRMSQEHPKEISPILSKLAVVYETYNDWEKAYHVQKELEDVDELASLIERAAPNLIFRALITLETWVNNLPAAVRKSRPGILSIRGIIEYMKGNLQDGLDLLNQAEANFRKRNDPLGLTRTLARRASAHRFLGNYPAALHDADEVIGLADSNLDLQKPFAKALREKGLSLYQLGQALQAVKVFEQALEIYVDLEDASMIPMLMMETGMVYSALGKEKQTVRLFEQALQIWKQEGNLTWQANVLNNMGVLHHPNGEYDKAVLTLEEGLLCANQSGYYVRIKAVLMISLADVYADVEDYSLAERYYQQGYAIAEEIGDHLMLNYLSLAWASLYIKQLDLIQANRSLDEAGKLILSQVSQYEKGLYNLLRGQLLLHEVQALQASRVLEQAQTCFETDGHKLEIVKSQILLAAAYYQNNKKIEARKQFKKALNSGIQHRTPIILLIRNARNVFQGIQNDSEVGQAVRDLLIRADQIDKEIPEIRRRIHRLAQTTEVSDAKLHIRAFGRAQVSIGEKPLTMSDWQTQSVRELFFYFKTINKPMTKEQIGDVFWPELEEPSKLKLRFKNDIYRLRRAIRNDVIVFRDELYSFNSALDYEYDVDAFESYLFQADLTQEPKMQIDLLQKAVAQVKGQFLEDISATWVMPERERINQIFLTTVMRLVELLKDRNQIDDVLVVCERAIEHEPSFEPAYLQAMQIHLQVNDRVSAVRLYKTYASMMKNELDLPPSSEMEALYNNLTL